MRALDTIKYLWIHVLPTIKYEHQPRNPVMMVTGIFCLLAVAVGEDWAGGGTGTRSGHSSSESIMHDLYGRHLLEINGSKCISGEHLLETRYTMRGWSSTCIY